MAVNVRSGYRAFKAVRGSQAERLVQLRKKYGWSMLACQTAMGVSFSTYRQYELGLSSPRADSLRRFHKELKLEESLHWLITGVEHGET